MKKYFLMVASLFLVQASVFADDLDAQPDQTYSSPAPMMDETPPGGDQTTVDPVAPSDASDDAVNSTDGDDSPVSGGSCPFSDDDEDDAPVDSQSEPEKYSRPDDQG